MKKIIAFVLVLLLATATIPAVGAAEFSDVPQGHWAKSYIEEMTERGLFTGYTDGTFRPNDDITLVQTLALLARLYDIDEESKQLLISEHNSYLTELLKGTSLTWAIPELAICLEAGIITKVELNGYASGGELGKAVEKELLSVFLVRAMQLEDEALSLTSYTLPFDDYLFITYTRRPYCYILYDIGVVGGDTSNRLNPKSTVNRAVSSTMLSRAIKYLEEKDIKLRITRFSEYSTKGILTEANAGSILLQSYDGSATRIIVPSSAYIKVDGIDKTLSSLYKGYPATLVWSKDDNTLKGIDIDSNVKAAYGVFKSIDTRTSSPKIYLTDLLTSETTGYALGDLTSVDYEGSTIALTSLKAGSYVTVLLKDDTVTSIYAFNGTYEKEGTIKSISFGAPIILVVTLSNGTEQEIMINPKNLPYITRDNKLSSIDKLHSGDTIKITVKNSVITQIDSQVKKADLTGTIKSIVKDISGNRLTLVGEDGKEYSYPLASGVQVTQGASRLSVDNLRLGSKANFVISDGSITSIDVVESITESNRVTGSVLFVNTREQTILLEVTNPNGTTSNVNVKLSASTKILNAKSGAYVNFNTFEIYDVLDIYGAYDGELIFEATIIIVR